ncbi:hypothetical protein BDM02DRAFT_3132040 [Thelephora ganbajun]|uniref:Uncharacterized protein n=1 Tax=Thelephora ganbajun TaxID=370292 RepID=A0ACB6Z2M7_THEGA|nr:hypothetical protein BDM02DRAFT_3132040 [Thelephora ganbajun]
MTREDIQRMADWIATHITGPIAGVKSHTVSLNEEDYPKLNLYMEDKSGKPISPGIKAKLHRDLFSYWNDLYDNGEEPKNFTDLGLNRKDKFCARFKWKYEWLCLCDTNWKVDHLWINYFGSWKRGPHFSLEQKPKNHASKQPVTISEPSTTNPKPMEPAPESNKKAMTPITILSSRFPVHLVIVFPHIPR